MNLKVIKAVGDTSKPDTVEADTSLKIGDSFEMEYDWCTKIPCINGYKPIWHKDIAEFTVVDIVCNMLINPSSVWVRLKSVDELFQKRCGAGCFDVPEDKVLERIREAENKKNRRKEKCDMRVHMNGTEIKIDGKKFVMGEKVICNKESCYEGLVGLIKEIRTGEDKETENIGYDIYCDLFKPILKTETKKIEEQFSKIYGKDSKIDEINFDNVILSPQMLDTIETDGIPLTVYKIDENWATGDDYGSSTDIFWDYENAIQNFKVKLAENIYIIEQMKQNIDFVSDESDLSYECFIEGFYDCQHYSLSMETKRVMVTDKSLSKFLEKNRKERESV